ncbi:unnamed protein product [Rhizophagus irregularis]|nr:unnamed protein product [Rhizophagus irregularis]
MRSTTGIIMGTIIYEAPVINEVTHLEDISLISTNRSRSVGMGLGYVLEWGRTRLAMSKNIWDIYTI